MRPGQMLIVTAPHLPGYRVIRVVGLVRGNTVRARNIGTDMIAGIRNLVGGEVPEYRKLMAESREQALDQMADEARDLGANAIVSVQFTTSMIARGMAELLVYGTAVIIEDDVG